MAAEERRGLIRTAVAGAAVRMDVHISAIAVLYK